MVSVSIAIRAYRRRWLGEAIDSVLRQSWRDLELVIYDDAGDLDDVAASFDDARIRYVRAATKLQASGRFAAAVALCRGRYVGVLDDDDRYEPAFVERLAAALDADPRAGVAFCREVWLGGSQPVAAWPAPSAMLLRRAALDAIDMPDGVAPDFFLHESLRRSGWTQVRVDEPLVVRRSHRDRIANSLAGADYALATCVALGIEGPELARRHVVRAVWHLAAGRRAEALADLRAARGGGWMRNAVSAAAHVPLIGRAAARLALRLRRR
jgi:glycosyltransferase involved in cell wall biosynthesis